MRSGWMGIKPKTSIAWINALINHLKAPYFCLPSIYVYVSLM